MTHPLEEWKGSFCEVHLEKQPKSWASASGAVVGTLISADEYGIVLQHLPNYIVTPDGEAHHRFYPWANILAATKTLSEAEEDWARIEKGEVPTEPETLSLTEKGWAEARRLAAENGQVVNNVTEAFSWLFRGLEKEE